MARLDGTQYRTLQNALLSAYPERDDLERLVRFELNQNLNAIAGGDDLTEVTYKLIEWYESRGRVQELIDGAKRDNPSNPSLAVLTIDLTIDLKVDAAQPIPEPSPAPPPALPTQQNGLMLVSLALTAALVALLALLIVRSTDLFPSITSGGGGVTTAATATPVDEPTADTQEATSEVSTPTPPAVIATVTKATVTKATVEESTPTNTTEPTSTPTFIPSATYTSAPASTNTPTSTPTEMVDETEQVLAIIQQEVEYGNARDLNGILSLWTTDAQIVNRNRTEFDPSDDVIYAGIDSVRSFYESYFALGWVEYDIHNPVATVKGNNAIVVHQGTFSDAVLYEDKVTFTLKKFGDRWQIVALEVGTTPP